MDTLMARYLTITAHQCQHFRSLTDLYFTSDAVSRDPDIIHQPTFMQQVSRFQLSFSERYEEPF